MDTFDLGKLLKEAESEETKLSIKNKLVEWLKESGESWAEWIELLPEPFLAEGVTQRNGTLKTRFEMILGTKEHEIHHRGQLTVIERMLGVVPHLTRRRRKGCQASLRRAVTKLGIVLFHYEDCLYFDFSSQ